MQSEIVIVGGGAGGLELACKLGRKLGPAKVMLVDSRLYHIWKPSLHEVAAGTLDIHQEGLSYQMLAHDNGFTFVYGPMLALDHARAPPDGRLRARARRRRSAARTPHRLRLARHRGRQHLELFRRARRARTHHLPERHRRRRALPPALAAPDGDGPGGQGRARRTRMRRSTSSSSAAAPPASNWRPNCAKPRACTPPMVSRACRSSATCASPCSKARRASWRRCPNGCRSRP